MDVAGPIPRPSSASVRGAAPLAPVFARGVIVLAISIAILASVLVITAAPHTAATGDPALTRLLRAMALIKAGMAAGVVGAIFWRLGAVASPLALVAYAVASAAMASGPVLIWGMTNLVSGALLLHVGLVMGVLVLWRDPATTERLKTLIATRRLMRR